MDCMRLFTKEDVLDGDEKPVIYFVHSYHFHMWKWIHTEASNCSIFSSRHVTGAKPGDDAQRNLQFRSFLKY